MADFGTKISELPAADALTGTEQIPGVQGGQTKKATAAQLATLVKNGLTKSDVGLGNVDNVRQYSAQNPPPTPSAADVGAIPVAQKGAADGVAELDSNGIVPASQLPVIPSDAEDISYDNTASGLAGNNVQDALDEVVGALDDKQDTLTFDNAPTEGSNNPVTSNGIYDAILKLYPTDTASGSPANFPDGADDVPVVDLKVAIGLAQSGSGTPSPANVRPITPWTGLTLSHSGADTSDPEELAVSWEDAAGHVWAGTLDVTTGVLTELYYDASNDALTMTVTGNTPNETVQARFQPVLQDFSTQSVDILSDRFSNYNGSGQSGMISRVDLASGAWLYLNIPQSQMEGTTTADVQAWVAAQKPVILLKRTTPVTWQLPPHAVKTLLGENNFWADTGAVTVEYRANFSDYITKKLPSTLSMSRPALTLGAMEPEETDGQEEVEDER